MRKAGGLWRATGQESIWQPSARRGRNSARRRHFPLHGPRRGGL